MKKLLLSLVAVAVSLVANASADLTRSMFKTWDGFDASAKVKSDDAAWDAKSLGETVVGGDVVYGHSSVSNELYADLTGYKTLLIRGDKGVVLRVLINRQKDNSLTELNPTIGDDGKVEVDLTSYEYFHLNAIKINWGASGVITSMELLEEGDNADAVDVTPFVGKYLVDATIKGNGVTVDMIGQSIKVEKGSTSGTVNITLPAAEWKGHSMAKTVIAGVNISAQGDGKYSMSGEGFKVIIDDTEFTANMNAQDNYFEVVDGEVTGVNTNIHATSAKGEINVLYTLSTSILPVKTSKILTAEDFKSWTAADGTGEETGTAGCDYVIDEPTIQPYGDSRVKYLNYANLSDWKYLVVEATEGTPRLLFNRTVDEGPVGYEYPNDATYTKVTENTDGSKKYVVDIEALVDAQGFAHLHAIKGAYWSNVTVTSMYLADDLNDDPTAVTSVEAAEVAAPAGKKVFVDGQLIIVKDGKQYGAAGAQIK